MKKILYIFMCLLSLNLIQSCGNKDNQSSQKDIDTKFKNTHCSDTIITRDIKGLVVGESTLSDFIKFLNNNHLIAQQDGNTASYQVPYTMEFAGEKWDGMNAAFHNDTLLGITFIIANPNIKLEATYDRLSKNLANKYQDAINASINDSINSMQGIRYKDAVSGCVLSIHNNDQRTLCLTYLNLKLTEEVNNQSIEEL